MNIEIKKAAIKSKIFLSCDYKLTEEDCVKNRKEDCDGVIHPDLEDAFKALVPHFVLLTEQEEIDGVENFIKKPNKVTEQHREDLHKNYAVTGFTIGGSGESEGITLSGWKRLENGKKVTFNTPFTRYESIDDEYLYIDDLIQAIDVLVHEVIEYLSGKFGTRAQTSMTFGDDLDDNDPAADFDPIPKGKEVKNSKEEPVLS